MDVSKENTLDKDTLKRIIIQLRADDHSFQEISDILLEKYGVLRSRQAVQGMFNRAINSRNGNLDDLVIKFDMLHIYQLGYSRELTVNIINEIHSDKPTTQYRLQLVLENSANNLKSIENEQLKLIEKGFKQKLSCDDIKAWLSYKGKEIKDTRFNALVFKLVTSKIDEHIKDNAASIMEMTGDKELAKSIAERFNTEFTLRDINRALNNI